MKSNLSNKGISLIAIIIIVVVVIAVATVGVYYFIHQKPQEHTAGFSETDQATEEPIETSEELIPENESTLDKAWRIYSKQLTAAEAQDAEQFNNLFYFLSVKKLGTIQTQIQACQKQAGFSEDECWAALKKNMIEWKEKTDFVNVFTTAQEDDRQIVLIGSSEPEEGSFRRYCLIFVKNPQDQSKVLILSSGYTGYGSDPGQVQDSDGDGYEDDKETCLKAMPGCVETDPNLKDTDGDGWWDSTEGTAQTDPNDADSYLF